MFRLKIHRHIMYQDVKTKSKRMSVGGSIMLTGSRGPLSPAVFSAGRQMFAVIITGDEISSPVVEFCSVHLIKGERIAVEKFIEETFNLGHICRGERFVISFCRFIKIMIAGFGFLNTFYIRADFIRRFD